MTGFEDLDDDVLYLILDYLYLERSDILRSFRLISRRLREFADGVSHRILSLIDDDLHEQITYRLTERLTDPSDKICHYVRDLRIVNFKGNANSYCLNDALIANCLRHIQRLDTFSWSCDTPIISRLLDDLRQRFPRVQIGANVRLIDQALLPVPQLHRLDVSIPCADFLGDYSISMFGALKQALLRSPSLRHLSIDTHHDFNIDKMNGAALDRLQLPLESGDELPALESLHIRSPTYAYDVDHCKNLLASMDHKRLHNLTLGTSNPVNFFKEFHQHLSNLSHLDISYTKHLDDPRGLRLDACANFISDLPSLKTLDLRFDSVDLRSPFFRSLVEVHGPNLRHLRLQCAYQQYYSPICHGNLRTFLWRFRCLQSLRMTFPNIQSYHRCRECDGYEWGDTRYFSFVPPIPSLINVDLSIQAPYTERPLLSSINAHAHCSIRYLWTTFAERSDSELETFSLGFWRWDTNGGKTGLKEVVFDSTRLRGRLNVRVRKRRDVPVVAYREVVKRGADGEEVVSFEL